MNMSTTTMRMRPPPSATHHHHHNDKRSSRGTSIIPRGSPSERAHVAGNRSRRAERKTEVELKTHIEVRARIRPLEINVKREGFFDGNVKKSNLRSPRIPHFSHQPPPSRRSQIRKPPVPTANNAGSPSPKKPSAPGDDNIVAWQVSEDGETASQSPLTDLVQGRTHDYTLDRVYGPDSTTRELYDDSIQSLVRAAMEGYNSSILAYGQTSTGKTFTMTGTPQSPGLVPLCIHDCFRILKKEAKESREYLLRLSYMEVYKEHIRDLLATTPQPVRLFEGSDGLVIKGLKEEIVTSPDQVFSILRQGEARRQVGATHMNQHSSRSHVMVRLWIESNSNGSGFRNTSGSRTQQQNGVRGSSSRVSSLTLVDLAGSESVRLNGAERRDEGQYINKSLMTLGQVVLSLSEQKTAHIPFRDSKLTRLLQPSLSGNCQMILLCCISPLVSHLEESHNTFKFATRAKKIKQKAVVNVTADETTLLQTYRDEIEDLRQQLSEAKEQQRILKEENLNNSLKMSVEEQQEPVEEVHELVEAIQTMERLILKSRPHSLTPSSTVSSQSPSKPEENADDDEIDLLSDDGDDSFEFEERDILDDLLGDEPPAMEAKSSLPPPRTPTADKEGDDLHQELNRIRGLLGSVLKKRGVMTPSAPTAPLVPAPIPTPAAPENVTVVSGDESFEIYTPLDELNGTEENREEVDTLRKQLEEQEVTTNLSKADASFLQSQLREKDMLLTEVSKVLEAVEKRQTELEKENTELRAELDRLKCRYSLL